jgi:hypothetical protein
MDLLSKQSLQEGFRSPSSDVRRRQFIALLGGAPDRACLSGVKVATSVEPALYLDVLTFPSG